MRAGRLPVALREGHELVAEVDEGHRAGPAAQRELEDLSVEGERLVDVADLEGHVVDPERPRARSLAHGRSVSRLDTPRPATLASGSPNARERQTPCRCARIRPSIPRRPVPSPLRPRSWPTS